MPNCLDIRSDGLPRSDNIFLFLIISWPILRQQLKKFHMSDSQFSLDELSTQLSRMYMALTQSVAGYIQMFQDVVAANHWGQG